MKKYVYILIGLVILAGIVFLIVTPGKPGKYDSFAQCLTDKDAVFYGAFWCSHCQAQKKLFGSSQKLLPYVECSTADGSAQTEVCIDKNITGYPTWEFADGSRLNGEIALQTLAEKTSCQLPVE